MRLDRFLTLYLFGPLTRMRRPKNEVRIPILMYHSVSEQDDPDRHPYFQTNTRPEVFARQMQFLADNQYNVISLTDAIFLINPSSHDTKHLTPNTVAQRLAVITFDDGHRDFHDIAWPILKKHGFTATMFLPTGYISNERKRLNGKDCLTWDEVKALAGEGAAFGAHTVSHVQLYDIDRGKVAHELIASKLHIEEKLGRPVEHYSYAYAFPEHDEKFVCFYDKSLREAGYQGALTTRIGTVMPDDNSYCLKRLPVNSCDDAGLLQAKLEGGYDWLNRVQAMKKKIRFAG